MEGGGFRGVYTAGVLDFFIDRKAMFSSVYGISAGACNALNYLSQDREDTSRLQSGFAMTRVIWEWVSC